MSSPVSTSANFDLFQKPASGAGKEELLLHAGINARIYDWSRDGKFIVYSQYSEQTKDDLWLLPLEGDRKPVPYLQTPFSEAEDRFSPDGRWMAYTSNESGQPQVYVQAIPPSGAKWQVSTAGGNRPEWRRDGKELFYVATDQKLMAAPVKAGSGFEAGSPQPLFEPVPVGYQPSADGQRFLVSVRAAGEASTPAPITVVVNWLKTVTSDK